MAADFMHLQETNYTGAAGCLFRLRACWTPLPNHVHVLFSDRRPLEEAHRNALPLVSPGSVSRVCTQCCPILRDTPLKHERNTSTKICTLLLRSNTEGSEEHEAEDAEQDEEGMSVTSKT